MKSNYPCSRKENIVIQELDGEVLVYDLSDNKAFCLNETSALVWELCDGDKSVAEISRSVGKKLNAPANDDLVWLALDQLKSEKLLENNEEVLIDFKGMNRRDVIKKVGLTSMLAIPVIMSVTSPVAASAASACGINLNSACTCIDTFNFCDGTPATIGQLADSLGCSGTLVNPPAIPGDTSCNSLGLNGCRCNAPFFCDAVAGIKVGICNTVP